jgi:hypothetical protein
VFLSNPTTVVLPSTKRITTVGTASIVGTNAGLIRVDIGTQAQGSTTVSSPANGYKNYDMQPNVRINVASSRTFMLSAGTHYIGTCFRANSQPNIATYHSSNDWNTGFVIISEP